jgi:hypothetical protein
MPDGTWYIDRVQYYFTPNDAAEIFKIQTSRRNEADFIAWFPEKRGLFTVKSAYNMAFDIAIVDTTWGATSSRPDGHRPVGN